MRFSSPFSSSLTSRRVLAGIAAVLTAGLISVGIVVVGASAASAADPADPASSSTQSTTTITPRDYVLWSVDENPSQNVNGYTSFPQTFVANMIVSDPTSIDLDILDSHALCGTYQVDAYADNSKTNDVIASKHLLSVSDAQARESFNADGSYGWNSSLSKVFTVTSGCTPQLAVAATACTTYAGTTSAVSVTPSGLVTNRTYNIVVTDTTTGQSLYSASGLSSTDAAQARSYTVPVGDSVTATVTDSASSGYTKSESATAGTCTAGVTPTAAISVAACISGTSGGSLQVNLSTLTDGRSYTITVKNSGGTVVNTSTVTGNSAGTTTAPITVPVTTEGAYRATVIDTLVPSLTSTSTPVSIFTCAVAAFKITLDPCSTPGGQAAVVINSDDLVDGTTYTAKVTDNNGVTTTTSVVAADGAVTVPVTTGNSGSVSIFDPAGTQVGASTVFNASDRCPEVAATTITAASTPAVAAAALATTGVDPTGPAIMAIIALQLGLALIGVTIIRRRRSLGH